MLVRTLRRETEVKSCTVLGKEQRSGEEGKQRVRKGKEGRVAGRSQRESDREGQGQRDEEVWHTRVGSLTTRLCKTIVGAFVGGVFMKSTSGKEGMEAGLVRRTGCQRKLLMALSRALGLRCLFSVVPCWSKGICFLDT